MGEFFQWLMGVFREFRIWVVILPWERAIRVRLGNRIKMWEPGWHIKLPFLDEIQVLNTRLRLANSGTQTLTTADGETLTVSLVVGFRITDPRLAMLRMHHPELSVASLALSAVSEFVTARDRFALRPDKLEQFVLERLRKEQGYEFEFARVADFAYARTYRLLNENSYRNGLTIDERKV